ncbi:MAG: hypothetical protein ACE5NA_00280 [Nitrospiraceae bacterium]
MKQALFAGLVLGLVPIQSTVLQHASIGGIRPDLCLIAVCLVGFLTGELSGMMLGLALGFVQELFSAGELWLSMVTKGMVGFLAGVVSRYLANATYAAVFATMMGMSLYSGLVFLVAERGSAGWLEMFSTVRFIVLPQAAFDAALGVGVYWLVADRVRRSQIKLSSPYPLGE